MPGTKRVALTWLFTAVAAVAACTTTTDPTPKTAESMGPPAKPSVEQTESIDWSEVDSTSIRNPNDGSLRGGVPLPLASPGLRFNPSRNPDARYGTVEMVRALIEAAERVHRELGGLPITINDLSLKDGGPIPRHRSHQSGRDVDVLFYQLGPDGTPIESVGAFFDPRGKGVDFQDLEDPDDDVPLTLDVPRTWLFLAALIEGERAQIQMIYVAEHIRTLLLRHARSKPARAETIARFEAITCQPGYPHDDHLHLRFFCTPDDIAAGCNDSLPMYPWQRKRLEAAGAQPRPLAPSRERARAVIVTHDEAREAAGPMHADVERWLDRREKWIRKPHPGRPYCP